MINLLPQEGKIEIFLEETKKLIIVLGVLFFLSIFSLILILLSLDIYFSGRLQIQQIFLEIEEGKFEAKGIKDFQDQVKSSNQKLSLLDRFYDQKISLAVVLSKIIKNTPQEIYLTDLSYSKNASQIILSGFSPSRDTLFQFKRNLEKDFQNVYFPPESWVKSTNIDFRTVSFQINQ